MSELLPENDLNPHVGYPLDPRPTYEEIVMKINEAWKDICSKIGKRDFQWGCDFEVIRFEKEIIVKEENFDFYGSINVERIRSGNDNKIVPILLVCLGYNDPHSKLTGIQVMLEELSSDQEVFALKHVTVKEDGNLENVVPGKVITTLRETGFQQSGADVTIVIKDGQQYNYNLYSDCNDTGFMNALSHALSRVSFKIPEKTNIV